MSTKPILIVNFFRTYSGIEPVRDWLKDRLREERRLIGEDIMLVQFRWPTGLPLVRKMETNLWEVRSRLTRSLSENREPTAEKLNLARFFHYFR